MKLVRALMLLMIALVVPLSAKADSTGSVRGYVMPRGVHQHYLEHLISDVIVTYSSPIGVFSARTNDKGFYVIFGMPPGKYTIFTTTPALGYDLLLSPAHVCIHAGDDSYHNLEIGFRDLPMRSAIEAFDYKAQFRPDASQTADVYSVGDCM